MNNQRQAPDPSKQFAKRYADTNMKLSRQVSVQVSYLSDDDFYHLLSLLPRCEVHHAIFRHISYDAREKMIEYVNSKNKEVIL